MAKQKTTQQFIFKINSTLLAKNNWDLIDSIILDDCIDL